MSDSSKASNVIENATTQFDDEESSSLDRERLIAEAAYFRAEKRGFEPGQEQDDWFLAEQEIAGAFLG